MIVEALRDYQVRTDPTNPTLPTSEPAKEIDVLQRWKVPIPTPLPPGGSTPQRLIVAPYDESMKYH